MEAPRCRRRKASFTFLWRIVVAAILRSNFRSYWVENWTESSKEPMHSSVILLFGRAHSSSFFVFFFFRFCFFVIILAFCRVITWHKWYQQRWRARNARRWRRRRKRELWTWHGYWARSKPLIGIAIPILSILLFALFFHLLVFFSNSFDTRIWNHACTGDDDAISKRQKTHTHITMTTTIWQKMRGGAPVRTHRSGYYSLSFTRNSFNYFISLNRSRNEKFTFSNRAMTLLWERQWIACVFDYFFFLFFYFIFSYILPFFILFPSKIKRSGKIEQRRKKKNAEKSREVYVIDEY